MSLKAKLFFWIGSLFLLSAIISYMLPRLFIEEDVSQLNELFDSQVEKQRLSQWDMKKKLFSDRIKEHISIVNGSLLYVYETPSVLENFTSTQEGKTKKLWDQASSLISYNPYLALLQVSDEKGFDAAIVTGNTFFYATDALLLQENIALVLLKKGVNDLIQEIHGPYIGVRLPDSNANAINTIYYLYSPQEVMKLDPDLDISILNPLISGISIENLPDSERASNTLEILKKNALELQNSIVDAKITSLKIFNNWLKENTKSLQIKKLTNKFNLPKDISLHGSTSIQKAKQNTLAREYVSIILDSIENSPFERGTPVGAATFFNSESEQNTPHYYGGAVLSKDIFFEKSLLDASSYYKKNPPEATNSPIASGIGLITSSDLEQFFITNTLKLTEKPDPLYLTLGNNLAPLVLDSFALNSEIIAFINEQGNVQQIIDGSGSVIPPSFFSSFPLKDSLDKSYGPTTIEGIPYHYFQLEDMKEIPLHIVAFVPDNSEPTYILQSIVSSHIVNIYKSLSYQLLVISAALLGVALIVLGILSRKITKPITMLARASEEVAAGHYDNAILPEVPKEQNESDEVMVLTRSFGNMVQGLKDKEKIRGLLDKVVSKEIASEILKGRIHLGGESKDVTILFSDIRNFTHRTEHLDPQTVITNLNGYMSRMSEIIEFEGGVIDKYVGDEIMALYGAPIEIKDGPLKAIKTAILMLQRLKSWNEERVKEGHPAFEIGIGIHTGKVVAGNMGAENRLNYTVLGANVNFAARLCAAAKPMEIRVSKETLDVSGAKELFIIEELPAQVYKGFSDPLVTYSIKGFK